MSEGCKAYTPWHREMRLCSHSTKTLTWMKPVWSLWTHCHSRPIISLTWQLLPEINCQGENRSDLAGRSTITRKGNERTRGGWGTFQDGITEVLLIGSNNNQVRRRHSNLKLLWLLYAIALYTQSVTYLEIILLTATCVNRLRKYFKKKRRLISLFKTAITIFVQASRLHHSEPWKCRQSRRRARLLCLY